MIHYAVFVFDCHVSDMRTVCFVFYCCVSDMRKLYFVFDGLFSVKRMLFFHLLEIPISRNCSLVKWLKCLQLERTQFFG